MKKITNMTMKNNSQDILNNGQPRQTIHSQNKDSQASNFCKLFFTASLLIGLLLFCATSFALELGLSPGDINFDHVLNGGYAEVAYTLSTDSVDNITINLYNLNDSSVNDWITYDPVPSFVTISQSQPLVGKIIVRVPSTATNGNYSIMNKFTVLRPLTKSDSDTTADIALSMGQKIAIGVVSNKVSGCTVYSDSLQSQSIIGEDVVERVFLRNDGNVNLDDALTYTIYDVNKTSVISQGSVQFSVLPTKIETLPLNIPTSALPTGQYVVSLAIKSCSLARDNLQFTQFAPGEKVVQGELTSLVVPVRVYNLTNASITGSFANTGDIPVSAHMITKVTQDGKIVTILESDATSVDKATTATFVSSFSPKAWGKYQLDSYIVYNEYQTPKTTAYVNFIDDSAASASVGISSGFILKMLVLVVIVVLLVLIIVKRKPKSNAR